MSKFESNIKNWVTIDNELKKLNERSRELRAQKSNVSEHILNYINTQQLNRATIQISDGYLKFIQAKHTPQLTFKYVESCLKKCIRETENIDAIMKYIKESREITHYLDIKRIYNERTNNEHLAEEY